MEVHKFSVVRHTENVRGEEVKRWKAVSASKLSNELRSLYIRLFVTRLEVAAEADAQLNRASKPAIEKLKMLPQLLRMLEKRPLRLEYLDRGVLSALKTWLEPLPDGSPPNVNIRSALLKLLTDLPIDLEVWERREQLMESGLGTVVMALSRLAEETPANRTLARDLVDKWSRSIFSKRTRHEDPDLGQDHVHERPPPPRMSVLRQRVEEARGGGNVEPDFLDFVPERVLKFVDGGDRSQRASRPEALPLDFVIRPASKATGAIVRAHTKRRAVEQTGRGRLNKSMQRLARSNKKNLHAARLSVEGRGLLFFR